ncbi:MAG: hypothetical protein MZW92_53245 [Comamonadaceae bacterium]|nr:hypothetical protein [Comamonadaceae bacterium]
MLVMDCSASMRRARTRRSPVRPGPRQGARPRRSARRRGSRPAGRGAVSAGDACHPGSEKAALGRALEALRPSQAPSDVNEAVLLAMASVPKGEPVDVFVFSDGTKDALVSDKALAGRVRYVQTGETDGNLAITRLAARSNPLSAFDSELFAELTNLSSQPRECRLELRMEEAVLFDRTVGLAPREKKAYVTPLPAGREGIIRAIIHADDEFDVDNQAFGRGRPTEVLRAAHHGRQPVSRQGLWINPRVVGAVAGPGDWTAASRERYDVVILDGFVPPVLPAANYLVLRHGQPAALLRGIRARAAASGTSGHEPRRPQQRGH